MNGEIEETNDVNPGKNGITATTEVTRRNQIWQPLHISDWKDGEGRDPIPMREFLEECEQGITIEWEAPDAPIQYNRWIEAERAPFEVIFHLGGDRDRSIVEHVKCLRCPNRSVARKEVNCAAEDAPKHGMAEIRCLKGLRHPHIVALVGDYLDQKHIGILLYPAAEWDLKAFMEQEPNPNTEAERYHSKIWHLCRYFVCLCQALDFLHNTAKIRHKDIKPKNILIDRFGNVLLSDFGISKKFRSAADSMTRTEKYTEWEYSTPEFIKGETRGRPADVFQLGIIFAEMATVILDRSLTEFRQKRFNSKTSSNTDASYPNNLLLVRRWMHGLSKLNENDQEPSEGHAKMAPCIDTILKMLDRTPSRRPEIGGLWEAFKYLNNELCPDCDPRAPKPWIVKPNPLSEEEIKTLNVADNQSIISTITEEMPLSRQVSSIMDYAPEPGINSRKSWGSTMSSCREPEARLPVLVQQLPAPPPLFFKRKRPPRHAIVYDFDNPAQSIEYRRWTEIETRDPRQTRISRFATEVSLYINNDSRDESNFICKPNLSKLGRKITIKRWMGKIPCMYTLNMPTARSSGGVIAEQMEALERMGMVENLTRRSSRGWFC